LSTSWVRSKSFDFARSQLSSELQARVIGATFHKREMRKEYFAQPLRGQQIRLDGRRRQPTDRFGIDDTGEGRPEFLERLVHTDPERGPSDSTIQQGVLARLSSAVVG
jgi:hypothetical protein